jgi:mannose-6-phosphate isomerase-like protein (cupin superfamily)
MGGFDRTYLSHEHIDTRGPAPLGFRATLLSDEMEGKMEATAAGVKIVGPGDAMEGFLGSIGVRFMIDGSEAGQRLSLVEHPMSPRALAAPLHLHTREDEYSFVLEGRMGALLGDDVVEAGPGDLVHKPRNQWHTFWNAGDEPCRILEIISPAGFEHFFRELVDMGGVAEADEQALAGLNERYGLQMRPETVPELVERFGVRIGEPLSGGWTPRVRY